MKVKKGILLAGGTGTRLYPLTFCANKQLLPIFDKPLIYYPLTTLMLAGIQDILIISSPKDLALIQTFLGSGEQWGVNFSYQTQNNPNGLPEAFILGEKFIEQKPVALILGDNFFHGHGLTDAVFDAAQKLCGAHLFVYAVDDPERYGIIELNAKGKINKVEEKPKRPRSNLAITGLYYFDDAVCEFSKKLIPSKRGELEIIDLIEQYRQLDKLSFTQLGRGYVWLDAGTPNSLLSASQYVEVIQSRQGTFIASPEEVAWRMGFIDSNHFKSALEQMPYSKYREYLFKMTVE